MIDIRKNILYEDESVLVCRKPAGVAVQTARLSEPDMESLLKNYLKSTELYVIHRLDQPVEGILLFGKTKEAAAVLNRSGDIKKTYCAVVLSEKAELCADQKEHTLVDYLIKNGRENTSRVIGKEKKDAKRAKLSYRIQSIMENAGEDNGQITEENQETHPVLALVLLSLETGRHHQIRVQMANAGLPLLGDLKYGSEKSIWISHEKKVEQVALCACKLSFVHPLTGEKMTFSVQPEGRVFQPFLPVNP